MKHTRHVSRSPQPIPAESLLVLRQQIAALGDFVEVFAAIIDVAGSWLAFVRDAIGKED